MPNTPKRSPTKAGTKPAGLSEIPAATDEKAPGDAAKTARHAALKAAKVRWSTRQGAKKR